MLTVFAGLLIVVGLLQFFLAPTRFWALLGTSGFTLGWLVRPIALMGLPFWFCLVLGVVLGIVFALYAQKPEWSPNWVGGFVACAAFAFVFAVTTGLSDQVSQFKVWPQLLVGGGIGLAITSFRPGATRRYLPFVAGAASVALALDSLVFLHGLRWLWAALMVILALTGILIQWLTHRTEKPRAATLSSAGGKHLHVS